MHRILALLPRLALPLLALGVLGAADNLLPNSDMESGSDGKVSAWGGAMGEDPANRYLRFSAEPGKVVNSHLQIEVGDAKALECSFRYRIDGVRRGAENWHDARIIIDFKNAAGETVKPGPKHPHFTGSSDGWQAHRVRFPVPAGATRLTLMPGLWQAAAGTFDLDDIELRPIAPEKVTVKERMAIDVVVDAGGGLPPMLKVDGRKIVTVDGNEVRLQGLNVASLEWTPTGEQVLRSISVGIDEWKANIIRLPVKASYWFGKDKQQRDSGEAYRALVDQAVLAAGSRGAYLILDLHHYRAPTPEDAEFWRDAATHYKDHPTVLFGLLNEPHGISWEQWRDGGRIEKKVKKSDVIAENQETIVAVDSPGMQGLVDVVRETGAKNIVVVGGLDWAYDLSGILNGFALSDGAGNGIVYDTHVYPWKRGWQKSFIDAAQHHPVLVGEVGADAQRYDWLPPGAFEDPYTWVPDMLACIQRERLHWTAWCFHPKAGPPALQNFDDYTPSPFWGAFVRAALLGARFESDRLR